MSRKIVVINVDLDNVDDAVQYPGQDYKFLQILISYQINLRLFSERKQEG